MAIDASVVELPIPAPAAADPETPAARAPVKAVAVAAHAAPHATPAALPAAEVPEPARPAPAPANEESPRFVLPSSISFASTGRPSSQADEGRGATGVASSARLAPLNETQVSAKARLLSNSPALYPGEARLAEIEGDIVVEIVVDAAGRVVDARSVTRLGYGLEAAATNAIRAYRFFPALKDGVPVPVRMRWTVEFRLR
jgi:protein TonB